MKSFLSTLFSILCMGLLFSGCRSPQPHDASALAPDPQDRLVIYTSHREAVYLPLIREFEARTGIWVQVETGGSMELLDRIAQEDTDCDILFGGGVDTLESHKDLFLPYESPLCEQILPNYRSASYHWTPFSSLPIVLAYNSKLVRLNPPSGWEDLLDPIWQGRIAYADPNVSASAFTALSTLLQVYPDIKTDVTLQRFICNLDGEILSSSSSVIEQIAHGNCYIGVTLEDEAIRSMNNGYDVAMIYPKEGTSSVCDGVAIIAGCDHPQNAQRFIDFILQKDVQTYLIEQCYRRSIRTDLQKPSPEGTFIAYDITWISQHQSDLLTLWNTLRQEVTP